MADQTTTVDSIAREDAADRLTEIASALRTDDRISVSVGNKDITLAPTDSVNFRLDVIEKRTRFRGDRETIRIELDWKPE
ncbi:amphi-Trp domain-containing protein [Halorientalis marina]|jgi:amphi-Trp domain-containing protein|uniref:amphi-Trp domain-containing protein n=1 Tax=Halorientalis marina TaxID=2931976 RepID=UPI001FF29882|nr:amphi-Trp domain-containing protein [Halorientalis marina]